MTVGPRSERCKGVGQEETRGEACQARDGRAVVPSVHLRQASVARGQPQKASWAMASTGISPLDGWV